MFLIRIPQNFTKKIEKFWYQSTCDIYQKRYCPVIVCICPVRPDYLSGKTSWYLQGEGVWFFSRQTFFLIWFLTFFQCRETFFFIESYWVQNISLETFFFRHFRKHRRFQKYFPGGMPPDPLFSYPVWCKLFTIAAAGPLKSKPLEPPVLGTNFFFCWRRTFF